MRCKADEMDIDIYQECTINKWVAYCDISLVGTQENNTILWFQSPFSGFSWKSEMDKMR